MQHAPPKPQTEANPAWTRSELSADPHASAEKADVHVQPFPGSDADLIENEIRPWTEANDVDLDEQGVHYVQGWTTMRAMVDAIRQVVDDGDEVTGPNIKAALEAYSGYSTGGVTNSITFTTTDHAGSKALQLYQVNNGEWERISDYISAGN